MVRHVLGISGGKDSAALAIYLKDLYPDFDIEYYSSDTGKELQETYHLINRLENYLSKSIKILDPLNKEKYSGNGELEPFDFFLDKYGGFLPSGTARWCTKDLKLKPFEAFVGNDQVISYVGIRGDEDRDGYISHKSNIQSIFPFRKNIWSEDVVSKVLRNSNIEFLVEKSIELKLKNEFINIVRKNVTPQFNQNQKLHLLLDSSVKFFNLIVFHYLKTTEYPIGKLNSFPLIENEDVLIKEDIFQILEDSAVGIPAYYKPMEYSVEIDGETKQGQYSRSRSGCYFCFFQQKIEWVWLYEQHNALFKEAMKYEKDGFSWMHNETLEELIKPARVEQIKLDHYKKQEKNKKRSISTNLVDLIDDDDLGCAACFV